MVEESDLIKSLAHFAAQPVVVWSLVGLFLAVFVWVLALFRREIAPIRQAVSGVMTLVRGEDSEQPAENTDLLIKAKRLAFVNRFQEIHEGVLSIRALSHAWSEFEETLIKPDDPRSDEAVPYYRNTIRPGAYVNLDATEAEGFHVRWYSAVPNWFIGVGLFFTFFGLLLALYAASHGIGGETREMQASLKNLLQAATFKFSTSLAGIGCSIVFSMYYRNAIGRLDAAFDSLCAEIETRMLFVTPPEYIARQQLIAIREQGNQFAKFNTDLAMSIEKSLRTALSETMPEILTAANQPMKESVDRFAERVAGANLDALSGIAEKVVQGVQGAAGAEMRQLAETLRGIQGGLGSVIDRLNGTGSDFSQQVAAAAQGLSGTMSGIAQQMQVIARSIEENLSNTQGRLDAQMAIAVERLEGAATAMSERMGAMSDSLQKAITLAAGNFTQEMQKGTESAGRGFEEAASRAQTQIGQAADSAAASLSGPVKALVNGLSGLQDTLNQAQQRISSQVSALDRISKSAANVADRMDTAAAAFAQSSEPLLRVSQDFARTAEALRGSIGGAASAMQDAQKGSQELLERTAAVSTQLERTLASYQQRFEKVDQDLATVVQALADALQGNGKVLIDFATGVEEKTAAAVQLLNSGIDDLQEVVEGLDRRLRQAATPSGTA